MNANVKIKQFAMESMKNDYKTADGYALHGYRNQMNQTTKM